MKEYELIKEGGTFGLLSVAAIVMSGDHLVVFHIESI